MAKYLPLNINNSKSNNMGILGAVGGIVGAGINYLGQQSTNEANLKLAKMQNDWNEQMWEKNNAYNAPSAQVQRLIEAGINPLGQNFTSYQSSPVESANLANQQAPQLDTGSIVQGFQGDRNLDIQEKLADAEIKLKDVQGVTEAKKAGLLDAQTAEQLVKNKFTEKKYKAEADQYFWNADRSASLAFIDQQRSGFSGTREFAELQSIFSQKNLNDALTRFNDARARLFPAMAVAEIRERLASARLSDANVRRINELLPYEKALSVAQCKSLLAGVYLTASQIRLNNSHTFLNALEGNLKLMGSDLKLPSFSIGKNGISVGEFPLGRLLSLAGTSAMVLSSSDAKELNDYIFEIPGQSYSNPLPDNLY